MECNRAEAQKIEDQVQVRNPIVCHNCSGVVEAGTVVRCPNCKACLRPAGLGVMCILGIAGNLCAIALAMLLASNSKGAPLPLAIIASVGVLILYGLMKGKWLAWVSFQMILGLSAVMLVTFAVRDLSTPESGGAVAAVVVLTLWFLLIVWALWWSIRTPRVREYCSGGKP